MILQFSPHLPDEDVELLESELDQIPVLSPQVPARPSGINLM